nr:WGR domain-containing protein [Deltaproteobacteria bacterium]
MPLFEVTDGTGRRFYRIELDGTRVTVHAGRIGTDGTHERVEHATEAEARTEYDRQIARRKERGYRLVHDETAPHDLETAGHAKLAATAPLTEQTRFRFVKRGRFVWLEASPDGIRRAEGTVDAELTAQPRVEPFPSLAEARVERDRRMATLIAGGWILEAFGTDARRRRRPKVATFRVNPELERTIAEDPDDEARWMVLEDWMLQHASDPGAELITLDKARRHAEAPELRRQLGPPLFGTRHQAIATALAGVDWCAGFV